MKIGNYIRTDKGYIAKISDFKEHYTKGKRLFKGEVIENFLLLDNKQCEIIESIDYSIPPCYPSDEELEKIKSHIIKSSPDILDLLKPMDLLYIDTDNDYAGGIIVPRIAETYCELKQIINEIKLGNYILKGVITKEQLENCMYKVGD